MSIARALETVRLVQVIWGDACHARDPKDVRVLKMMSFGFLIKDEAEGVVVAQSQSECGDFIDCLFVPRAMVIEVTPIAVPDGKGKI